LLHGSILQPEQANMQEKSVTKHFGGIKTTNLNAVLKAFAMKLHY